ncbi:N-acetylmannosamine-6-phosphate 2-epimerase [Clostridium perfringens]|nr:N-acetylmannosamine-6-phosphate 2-epimerase [Clostridium perfringens]
MKESEVLSKIKNGLIVSCQALENEPLHSSFIMARMARAAKEGGAVGIRANSYEDIVAIKEVVDIPVIGLVKRNYQDSDIYITPTMKEVIEIIEAGADIIALDATNRLRPGNKSLDDFFNEIKNKYPNIILMADISNYEEGIHAENLGFDIVSTTLSSYTEYTKDIKLPNYKLLSSLSKKLTIPVIAEGGIWSPKELKELMDLGAFAAVVGTAITRPKDITKKFVSVII